MSYDRKERRKNLFEWRKHPEKKPKEIKPSKGSYLIFSLVGLVFVFVFVTRYNIVNFNEWLAPHDTKSYGATKAIVYSFDEEEIDEQTMAGSKSRTTGYIIKYKYVVNGKIYDKKEVLNNWVPPDFIIYVVNNLDKDVFSVRYKVADPESSKLVERIKK